MRKIFYLLSGVFVALSAAIAAVPAQAAPAYTYTIDCLDPATAQMRILEPGSTVTLIVNNCQEADSMGPNAHSWSPVNPTLLTPGTWQPTETFTVVIGADGTDEQIVFNEIDGGTPAGGPGSQTWIYFSSRPPVANPAGALLESTSITIAPNASTFDVTANGFTGPDGSTCAMQNGAHSFGTTTVNVTQAGTYTFRVTQVSEGTQDPILGIYTAFDPLQPEANLIACDDDGGNNGYLVSNPDTYVNSLFSEVVVTLEPGTYVLLGSTYGFNNPVTGWTFTTDQSTTVQMWGPPLPPVVEPATLAVTGSTVSAVLPWTLLVIALGAGSLVTIRTLRKGHKQRR